MRDEEFNEIMPVENGKLQEKKQGELDENAIQAMKMIVGLSQEVSRANAEKYRAQAEITIAEIEKNKQNESEEIAEQIMQDGRRPFYHIQRLSR